MQTRARQPLMPTQSTGIRQPDLGPPNGPVLKEGRLWALVRYAVRGAREGNDLIYDPLWDPVPVLAAVSGLSGLVAGYVLARKGFSPRAWIQH
jgi:hypothetical protein